MIHEGRGLCPSCFVFLILPLLSYLSHWKETQKQRQINQTLRSAEKNAIISELSMKTNVFFRIYSYLIKVRTGSTALL